MKSILFILCLCAVQFFECNSFNFGSLFSGNSYRPNPSSVHISSNKPSIVVLKQENIPSDEYLEADYNVSISSLVEMLENSSDSNWPLLSEMNNTTEYVVSSSSSVVEEVPHIPVKNGETSTDSSVSSESSSQTSTFLNVTQKSSFNASTEEQEGVVLGTQAPPSQFTVFTKNIYEKTVEWVGDTYTLSILVPVAAGLLFAVTIILVVATCRCVRRSCRRRRFRKRVLPDSIKTLRPSDRARLLGDCDSSDEEF